MPQHRRAIQSTSTLQVSDQNISHNSTDSCFSVESEIPYKHSMSSLSFMQTFFAGWCSESSLNLSAFRFRDGTLTDGSSSIMLESSSSIITTSLSSTMPVPYKYFKVSHLQFSVVTFTPAPTLQVIDMQVSTGAESQSHLFLNTHFIMMADVRMAGLSTTVTVAIWSLTRHNISYSNHCFQCYKRTFDPNWIQFQSAAWVNVNNLPKVVTYSMFCRLKLIVIRSSCYCHHNSQTM